MDSALELLLSSSQHCESDTAANIPRPRSACCCGNPDCAYLKHHQSALDGLQRDVRTAGRLGQALLARHETYVTESENERQAMALQIEMLEQDKQILERRNTSLIEENRSFLNQLEAVNNEIAESDSHVTNLQSTLLSAQEELRRLSHLAIRTERLEQQLADYEREHVIWQSSLEAKEESERSAVRRQQNAERALSTLQEQIERIEFEAKEERERHLEVVARMERRHAVENELNSAAGRLKGAAAARASVTDGGRANVVSHFVKDILQDNANLQMGIVELREMLQTSNDEVETLRVKLIEHQTPEQEMTPIPNRTSKDLMTELQRAASQELHVHHHYHAPTTTTPKAPVARRPRKKRYGTLASGHFSSSSGYNTPRSSMSFGTPSAAATILQQTAVSIPQSSPANRRWSTQSGQNSYDISGPSSPRSATNRSSSLFDRSFSDIGLDTSRPTTPDTEDPGSPVFAPCHSKRASFGSFRTYSAPVVQRGGVSPAATGNSLDAIMDASVEELPPIDHQCQSATQEAIPEENDNDWDNGSSPDLDHRSVITSPTSEELVDTSNSQYQPKLRRAASHESLFSISGMDIHTLKPKPSQLLRPYASRVFTPQAVVSDAQALGSRPAAMSRPLDSSRDLLSGMAIDHRQQIYKPSFGKKVGGWMFGKWGASPTPTAADSRPSTPPETTAATGTPSSQSAKAATSLKAPSVLSTSSDASNSDPNATPRALKVRSPGINQPGPIFGFSPEVKRRTPPVMKVLDQEALRGALES
ncbi:Hypothetical protein R9X50_00779300 [Acrodontium crateriforme]|uniref:Uncharacterized protein n=1 Tax=Acrodontium crateriforme TaxID=150365 RepID=A0AAQ3R812_9PEZI|nr:Hypothetical protein R9X50_00779300 [Acrodontium crateriforme]